jgi:hypothetical protein
MCNYLVIAVFCLLYTIVFSICRKALDRRKGRPSRGVFMYSEGLLIESRAVLSQYRGVASPLIERRLRSLLSLIDAWLLDREIAKDPKLRAGSPRDD